MENHQVNHQISVSNLEPLSISTEPCETVGIVVEKLMLFTVVSPRISTPAASCKSFLGQCWKVPGSRSYYSSASTRIWPMLGTKTTHETVWKPSSFHNMRFFLSCLLQKKEQMKHARRATSSQATKKGQWIHLRNSKNPNMKVTSQNCIWNRRIGRESLSICLDSLEDTCVIHCPFDWTVQ